MQLRSSLKQLWIESKANPGFTILYVGGVAFTVTFTMVIAMIFYVHVAPVYPEYNRGTTSYISSDDDEQYRQAFRGRIHGEIQKP